MFEWIPFKNVGANWVPQPSAIFWVRLHCVSLACTWHFPACYDFHDVFFQVKPNEPSRESRFFHNNLKIQFLFCPRYGYLEILWGFPYLKMAIHLLEQEGHGQMFCIFFVD